MEEKKFKFPQFLIDELYKEYGTELTNEILNGYREKRVVSFRINTLKTNTNEIYNILNANNIKFEKASWSKDAIIVNELNEQEIQKLEIYKDGKIYMQSLSSMLPAIILNPKENIDILDMTAAPGGKTTQIAAITNNKANITACEMNSIRAQRLKFNIEKQGATSVSILKEDSRKLSNYFAFDQILLDAPCSGSGTIRINNHNSYINFSETLVKKSINSQKLLLEKAIDILKLNHEMVYSTCSILKQENEEIIKEELTKESIEIIPIEIKKLENIKLLPCTIKGCMCISPTKYYDGFFIAKIKKVK